MCVCVLLIKTHNSLTKWLTIHMLWHENEFISNQIYASINKQTYIQCVIQLNKQPSKSSNAHPTIHFYQETIALNDIVAEISFSFVPIARPPPRHFVRMNWIYMFTARAQVLLGEWVYACIWTIVRYLKIFYICRNA